MDVEGIYNGTESKGYIMDVVDLFLGLCTNGVESYKLGNKIVLRLYCLMTFYDLCTACSDRMWITWKMVMNYNDVVMFVNNVFQMFYDL